jgi:hypothetical protein
MEQPSAQELFLPCFVEGFSRARNVLPSTFSFCTRHILREVGIAAGDYRMLCNSCFLLVFVQ